MILSLLDHALRETQANSPGKKTGEKKEPRRAPTIEARWWRRKVGKVLIKTLAGLLVTAASAVTVTAWAGDDAPAPHITPTPGRMTTTTSFPEPEPTTPGNSSTSSADPKLGALDIELPAMAGRLPHSNIEVRVKNVNKEPLQEVWVGIHNKNDAEHHWNFYSCARPSEVGDYLCPDVVVGKTKDSPGPWTIVAVLVDATGSAIITYNRPALVSPNLIDSFGSSLKAYGARDAQR
jgi:hypothetical protein